MKTQLFQAAIKALSWLPLSTQHKLGALIGRMFWRYAKRERTVTRINLSLCFPDESPEWRDRLAQQSLIETGKAVTETGAMWCWPQGKLLNLVKRMHNEHLLEDAIASKKGVILVSPHIGAWELVALYVNSLYPMVIMYRSSRSAALDPVILKARERFGCEATPASAGGLRAIIKGLKDGKVIGILPDQEPDRKSGVFAPFFQTPACTMTLLGSLAHKTSAAVVFCVMKRLSDGYELHFVKAESGIENPDTVVSATAVNRTIERCIKIAPEQYLWSYKRFRLMPDGSKRDYKNSPD